MTILGKKQMSEEDIKLNYITPVILNGWKGHMTMETKITDGRINISGNIVARSKPKFADYMLYLNDGKPIAVVEAKDNNHSVSHGLQQAMTYAQMMDLPFAYSSNGDAFYEHDFFTGQERQIVLEQFPTQDELVARYYAELNGGKGVSDLEKKIVSQPYYSSQSTYPHIMFDFKGVKHSLSVSYRKAYIPSLLSGMLRDRRSEPSLHKQAGHCRSDNPALTAGSGYRQLRFQRRCSQWKAGFHHQKPILRRLCLC